MKGICPLLGGLIMYFAGGWCLWTDWDVATGNSYTTWKMPFPPHWQIGGVFMIAFVSAVVGVVAIIYGGTRGPRSSARRPSPAAPPPWSPRPTTASPAPRTSGASPGGGDPPEPPAALRARAVVLRRHTGHSPGTRPGSLGR